MTKKLEKKYSVFESELVPPHRILKEDEKKAFLEKYKVKLSQLPRILSTDPAVVELGAKPGDIIEIIREVPTIGKSKYYRIVIPAKK